LLRRYEDDREIVFRVGAIGKQRDKPLKNRDGFLKLIRLHQAIPVGFERFGVSSNDFFSEEKLVDGGLAIALCLLKHCKHFMGGLILRIRF
jgi:hypothetical protein